ncbi:olfactomedin-4 [Kryptolebias marmoratus]|uniref:Olfactomedin-4-like n=1 Tax=Kryptolebias marmoratus TaxID=37003 RepID=A0A3Q3AXG6_KRYMA|nr:olfactomedin-4 [Kryptolebias marmoratus]
MLLILILLFSPTVSGQTQRVSGQKKSGMCACEVNSTVWSFPTVKFESVQEKVETCEASLNNLGAQVLQSSQRLPQIENQVLNMTARLEPFQYLHDRGLYTDLTLRLLGQEMSQLQTEITVIHSQLNNSQTKRLTKEVGKLHKDVQKMQTSDSVNMKTVKEKLRYLKNNVESCKSIPKDFKGQHRHCLKGLITNFSDPITTKVSPYTTKYISGSWGMQAQMDSDGEKSSYWVQPLVSSDIYGNTMRVYQTYKDFMASVNHKDVTLAPSQSHANSVEGPSAVLYGEALYYHCYRSADVCRYDLKTNTVKRVTLPGTGVGFNNKFPYCYYDCRSHSDVDLEADETGLWALYASIGNHGNLVASKLFWDNTTQTVNVSQTWETKLFKKSVTNAFMVCGVLYATRYVDESREEVFYAFDTATGKEDNSLALPLQKVAKGVASLSYNPNDRKLYMFNDGYLLAYQAFF